MSDPTRLSLAHLGSLPNGVGRPAYRREDLTPGIVHFGVGNFHRAHQAVYLDRLMNQGLAHDYAIVGVGTRPGDAAVVDALTPQDCLTTVVEQSAQASSARITGVMTQMIGPGHTGAIIDALADPRTRIVSLTITEGGYFIDPATGAFDAAHPEIVADRASSAAPQTVFGLILEGLARRWQNGTPPFAIASCDNIPHNGHVARAAVSGLAALRDQHLAARINAEVAFPSSMVDRITPATSARERALVRSDFGVADNWPVFCEDYIQWVMEDAFPAGRPPLEEAGVTFVADVSAHEAMKIRILNGGHAVIAYPAALMDIEYAHEAMAHPLVCAFLNAVERDEIIPHVPEVPGTDLIAYLAKTTSRFANPKVADTVRRLCFDGSNRQPKFIVPSVRDRLSAGGTIDGLALVCALWCRYCAGTTDSRQDIAPNDPDWARLTALAHTARETPAAWLQQGNVYGDLAENGAFADVFAAHLGKLWQEGTAATLDQFLHR
ncbi:MAG: mannitol dehydrogenase family protein [Pseudomonadota bacterium]